MMMESVKETLKSLCLNNGWSYAVFWSFNPRNHMLLSMGDAYYENHARSVVGSMPQVHMLGEGIVGEAALDGKHRWVFVDAATSEFGLHFSSGIKTVAVIPVESRGVVQFGSTKEILEASEFLDQARKFLQHKDSLVGVASTGTASSSLISDASEVNGLFPPTISFQNPISDDFATCWENMFGNTSSCSTIEPLPFPGEAFDGKSRDQCGNGDFIIDQAFGSLVNNSIFEDIKPSKMVDTFEEQLVPAHFPPPLFDPSQIEDLSQWLDDSSKLCVTGLDATVPDEISHTSKVECVSSVFDGSDIFSNFQGKQSASPSLSSLSNALNSCGEGKTVEFPGSNELMAEFGIDLGHAKLGEYLDDVINPVADKVYPLPIDTDPSISECISGTEGGYVAAPRKVKGLFSELGLEHLLRDGASSSSSSKSCVDDPWIMSKKRRIETYQTANSQIHLSGHSPASVKLIQSSGSGGLKECVPKSKTGLWIGESYGMDAKSCFSGVNAPTRKSEEPAKATKKRARPGESSRPRPKDRQMIADRIKELRDLIPNGAKLSIDALLGRTVKHMVFMQSLTKHADKLKQLDQSKLVGQGDRLVQKGNSSIASSGSGSRGATWAYEVGGTNLFCPIIVEDLSHPGQMLIEMLCEERGYFLEIADVVRGFGLTILKGVMEARDDKIWAHFIVEGNRHVTRMEVFVSLMQLLQGTSTSEVNTTIESSKVANHGAPLWSNYQQHVVSLPMR